MSILSILASVAYDDQSKKVSMLMVNSGAGPLMRDNVIRSDCPQNGSHVGHPCQFSVAQFSGYSHIPCISDRIVILLSKMHYYDYNRLHGIDVSNDSQCSANSQA
jgi:hypothetical protein